MGIFFLITSAVAWIGSIIVSGKLRDNRELEDSSRSMLLGVFDLIVGVCFYFIFTEIAKDKYMPRSEKLFIKLLTLEGIVYMITGGIQLVGGFIAGAIQQEVEKKVEDRLNQSKHVPPAEIKDVWKCLCGHTNAGMRNSCSKCGRTKKDGLQDEKRWMCQCGALNPYSRNSCGLCGKRIPGTDRQVNNSMASKQKGWTCSSCGHKNETSERVCEKCGMRTYR